MIIKKKWLLRISSQLFSVQFWSSHSILSFSHTLAQLEKSWSILGELEHSLILKKEGKGKQESARE